MDIQDEIKAVIDMLSHMNHTPAFVTFRDKLVVSLTKGDPIDREESMHCDYVDFVQELVKSIILRHRHRFACPEGCYSSFILAAQDEKKLIHDQANLLRQQRACDAARRHPYTMPY